MRHTEGPQFRWLANRIHTKHEVLLAPIHHFGDGEKSHKHAGLASGDLVLARAVPEARQALLGLTGAADHRVGFGTFHGPVSTFGSSMVASISSVSASTRRYRSTTCSASE